MHSASPVAKYDSLIVMFQLCESEMCTAMDTESSLTSDACVWSKLRVFLLSSPDFESMRWWGSLGGLPLLLERRGVLPYPSSAALLPSELMKSPPGTTESTEYYYKHRTFSGQKEMAIGAVEKNSLVSSTDSIFLFHLLTRINKSLYIRSRMSTLSV